MWSQIRLLLEEQSDLGPHCLLQRHFKRTSRPHTADNSPEELNIKLLFRPSPDGLTFQLSFAAPIGDYLKKNITAIIETQAPHERIGNYELLDVGDLRIIWNERGLVVSVTNYTGEASPTVYPSSPIDITSTIHGSVVYCK